MRGLGQLRHGAVTTTIALLGYGFSIRDRWWRHSLLRVDIGLQEVSTYSARFIVDSATCLTIANVFVTTQNLSILLAKKALPCRVCDLDGVKAAVLVQAEVFDLHEPICFLSFLLDHAQIVQEIFTIHWRFFQRIQAAVTMFVSSGGSRDGV